MDVEYRIKTRGGPQIFRGHESMGKGGGVRSTPSGTLSIGFRGKGTRSGVVFADKSGGRTFWPAARMVDKTT